MNQPIPKRKLDGIDGIRALACLWVFCMHIIYLTPELRNSVNPIVRILSNGDLGVAVFFVLSGYLLTMPFWRSYHSQQEKPNIKVYFLRRLARIIPEFYVCILLCAFVANAYSGRWAQVQLGSLFTFTAPFLPAMFAPSFNIALWSIGVEMHFYFLLPLLMFAIYRCSSAQKARLLLVVTFIVLAGFQAILLGIAPAIESAVNEEALFCATSLSTTRNSLAMFAHFLFGVLASDIHVSYGHKITKNWRYDMVALTLIAIMFVPQAFGTTLPQCDWMSYQWPLFPACIGGLLFIAPGTKLISRMLNGSILRHTATLSFGIYLYHLFFANYIVQHWPDFFNTHATRYILNVIFVLGLSYIAAAISYLAVGRPALILSRKIEKKWLKPHTLASQTLAAPSHTASRPRQAA